VREEGIKPVKQPPSNPLRDELARSRPVGPHPDEGSLAAFAEGALLARERGAVMEHLAACAECREVLSLAADARPETAALEGPRVLPVRPPLRGWLPWVAVAAGVVVVSSAVVLHQREAELRTPPPGEPALIAQASPPPPVTAAQPAQVATPQIQAMRKRAPQPIASPGAVSAPATGTITGAIDGSPAQQSEDAVTVSAGALETGKKAAPPADAPANESFASLPAPQPVGQAHGAMGPAARLRAEPQLDSLNAATAAAKAAPAATPTMAAAAPATITGASATTASAQASGFGGSGLAGLSKSLARPRWRINDSGQAERSLGNGEWQAVLPDVRTKMRVVSVFGDQVWLGGEGLRLYHSADGGATWVPVDLPSKGGSAPAIAHVHFDTAQTGSVQAGDGVQWSTTDGGRTWK